jgi:hypothetical protein
MYSSSSDGTASLMMADFWEAHLNINTRKMKNSKNTIIVVMLDDGGFDNSYSITIFGLKYLKTFDKWCKLCLLLFLDFSIVLNF